MAHALWTIIEPCLQDSANFGPDTLGKISAVLASILQDTCSIACDELAGQVVQSPSPRSMCPKGSYLHKVLHTRMTAIIWHPNYRFTTSFSAET
jgi:hypothetical protein